MMSHVFRIFTAVLLLAQLVFVPLASAQEQLEGELPTLPESEVCTLDWDQYKIFTAYRLAYQTAVVDGELVFAEDLFGSMQDILIQDCGAVASIIQVKAEPLDNFCNDVLNHLLAKNKYYVTQLDADSAIATQGLIQTVLETSNCDSILVADEELAIELIQQDIQANYTIDLDAMVIPWESNVCFMEYGPAHAFVEQIERIQDASIATSLFDTVNNYIGQLAQSAADMIQQDREGTLLAFAKNIIGFKKIDMTASQNYGQTDFPVQTAEIVGLLASMSHSQGLEQLFASVDIHLPQLMDYAESIMTLPYRDDFADPRAQSIFASIQDTPITLIWDHLLASFSVQPGDKGITIVIPATEEQPQQQIRILNVEGHRWLDEYTDNDGALYYEEDRVPTRIVADFWSDESKILGLDREASYDEDYNILEGTIAVFLDPYIYTNHFTSTRTQDDDGDRKVMDFDIRIFGPAGCDIQIQWLEDDYYNYSDGQQSTTHSIDLHFNNTHIELVVTDLEAMLDEIQEHRVLFPTATSAPMTANHVLTAKIYSKGIHAANIIPVNNDRWIVFMDGGPGTYITTAINQALTDTINNPLLVAIRDLLSMLSDDEKQDAYIDDIKSPELTNLVQCTDSDGYVSGYYYYPTQDIMLSSYCLEMYDTCGVYSHTIDGLDLYFRDSGPDTASCNNLDIYITEPGNNDPEPSNNNPPKSDNNDPEPDGDDQGGSGYEEIFGCTDDTATNHNPDANADDGSCTFPPSQPQGSGCPDDGATNYDDNWQQTGENRDICDYNR